MVVQKPTYTHDGLVSSFQINTTAPLVSELALKVYNSILLIHKRNRKNHVQQLYSHNKIHLLLLRLTVLARMLVV